MRVARLTAFGLIAFGRAGASAWAGLSLPVPGYLKAAVADTARPEADRARDADRKPAETMHFAGIRQGESWWSWRRAAVTTRAC